MTWASRLASFPTGKSTNADSADSAVSPQMAPIDTIGAIDKGAFSENQPANDSGIITPCSRCGTPSPLFIAIINRDLWQCDGCLPADPNDQAAEAIERQAIVAEGNPIAPVLITMPVSWADASIAPTPGARCRNCNRASWWCERDQPRGWRCSTCHPGDHLPADRRREVMT